MGEIELLSLKDRLRIESGKVGIEEWLRTTGIYDDVMDSVKSGVRSTILFRVLRQDYNYRLGFDQVKMLCQEYGPTELEKMTEGMDE